MNAAGTALSNSMPGEIDFECLVKDLSIVVILPCRNEEKTIGKVVHDFHECLPGARVYVYDNDSSDRTQDEARKAGAIVRSEPMRGKGNVVRRMFSDISADIYVMADGDQTYAVFSSRSMVAKLIRENLDMVVGTRLNSKGDGLFRAGHRLGNGMLTAFVGVLFGRRFRDILSGYRVFSKRFVKSFPGLSTGFEIETELTIHALVLRMPVGEVEAPYFERLEGSVSKLSTYRDGLRIVWTIVFLLKELRPLLFFGIITFALLTASLGLAYPLLGTYIETGLVPRFPTAILATGLMILSFLSLACGFILDSVCAGRWEAKRMTYLSIPSTLGKS
jgi:glycosyltransferase involved in cell wall biosynthesis